ncbi:Holliday junction resolvase RuvX [Alkalicoccus luteus]|uniref:Putative pre-16S rRNA nuclease n=1 Tax=Alkalicoccus luteus TaxID=1237094 RepID=A0A969TTR2_9BACI|nr:Holliday junction resolvase RuvX [Alkalicoccus luteus]NJP36550.1 Holliday junction resolvase RuvX [Alkalicoccus luteus]
MRTAGLDVGTKTIGVAVSDAFGWTAQGVKTVRRTDEETDLHELKQLFSEHEVSAVVVGLPKNMNGTLGPSAELCMAFAEMIRRELELPVEMWDERLSTSAAEKMLVGADVSRKKRKKVIDKMAAVMILQNYLDSRP